MDQVKKKKNELESPRVVTMSACVAVNIGSVTGPGFLTKNTNMPMILLEMSAKIFAHVNNI